MRSQGLDIVEDLYLHAGQPLGPRQGLALTCKQKNRKCNDGLYREKGLPQF